MYDIFQNVLVFSIINNNNTLIVSNLQVHKLLNVFINFVFFAS